MAQLQQVQLGLLQLLAQLDDEVIAFGNFGEMFLPDGLHFLLVLVNPSDGLFELSHEISILPLALLAHDLLALDDLLDLLLEPLDDLLLLDERIHSALLELVELVQELCLLLLELLEPEYGVVDVPPASRVRVELEGSAAAVCGRLHTQLLRVRRVRLDVFQFLAELLDGGAGRGGCVLLHLYL